jgi:hypothetical protein
VAQFQGKSAVTQAERPSVNKRTILDFWLRSAKLRGTMNLGIWGVRPVAMNAMLQETVVVGFLV